MTGERCEVTYARMTYRNYVKKKCIKKIFELVHWESTERIDTSPLITSLHAANHGGSELTLGAIQSLMKGKPP